MSYKVVRTQQVDTVVDSEPHCVTLVTHCSNDLTVKSDSSTQVSMEALLASEPSLQGDGEETLVSSSSTTSSSCTDDLFRLYKGQANMNLCGFWSILNVLRNDEERMRFTFNRLHFDPSYEFRKLLGQKKSYDASDFEKYFKHLIAEGQIKGFTFEEVREYKFPHFICTEFHEQEESFVLFGLTTNTSQKDTLIKIIKDKSHNKRKLGKFSRIVEVNASANWVLKTETPTVRSQLISR